MKSLGATGFLTWLDEESVKPSKLIKSNYTRFGINLEEEVERILKKLNFN